MSMTETLTVKWQMQSAAKLSARTEHVKRAVRVSGLVLACLVSLVGLLLFRLSQELHSVCGLMRIGPAGFPGPLHCSLQELRLGASMRGGGFSGKAREIETQGSLQ